MKHQNSALLLGLLFGSICSCAAYYFPDGPPHRPSRQATVNANGSEIVFKPEPKAFSDPIAVPLDGQKSDVPVLMMDPVPSNHSGAQPSTLIIAMDDSLRPEPRQHPGDDQPPPKPEPRALAHLQMVPKRKDPSVFGKQRQSSRCSQTYAFSQPGQSVLLQSPNYSNEYPNNIQTSTCFTSPSGTTITVSCDDFNVEYSRSCSYDYFGIALGGNPSSIQKYCGRGNLKSPPSSGNSLAIVFRSDHSNPGSSNRSPYRFSCNVAVSGDSSEGGGGNPPTTSTAPPLSGNCTCGQRNDGSRIVGGSNARRNEFPWRCYLKTNRYAFFCGCSVISNQWILTAAHCTAAVMPLPRGDVLSVVVGAHDRTDSTSGQQIAVEKVFDHPGYDDQTMDNDVSLLKLSQTITYSNAISPICLPFKYANDEFSGTTVTASGWGTTSQGGTTSNILKEVDLPVLTTEQCTKYYPGQITERMICTYQPGKDTCQGDSGGSIDLNRGGIAFAIGVTSWGIGCARDNNPGVYAKTTKFLNYITTTTGESFCRV